jgi:hypothetical protein
MKDIEMGKFMLWLTGIFPQWKPDASIAPTWAAELPDITAAQAVQAVRKMQARKPSPFPPSVFEIIAEMRPPKISGHEVFQKILDYIRCNGSRLQEGYFTPMELIAIRRIGGLHAIGNSQEDDPFFLKSFISIWNDVQEEENVLPIERTGEQRQIGNGEGLREIGTLGDEERGLVVGNEKT